MTFDVKTYNVIAQEGIDVFPKDSYTVNQTEKPDALLIRSQDMHKTAFGTNVLAIARQGTCRCAFDLGSSSRYSCDSMGQEDGWRRCFAAD